MGLHAGHPGAEPSQRTSEEPSHRPGLSPCSALTSHWAFSSLSLLICKWRLILPSSEAWQEADELRIWWVISEHLLPTSSRPLKLWPHASWQPSPNMYSGGCIPPHPAPTRDASLHAWGAYTGFPGILTQRAGGPPLGHGCYKTLYKWETSVVPSFPLPGLSLLFLCGIHHACNYLFSICLLLWAARSHSRLALFMAGSPAPSSLLGV